MSEPDKERRRYTRVPAVFMVTFSLKKPLDVTLKMAGKECAAVGVNIGTAGMGIEVEEEILPGTEMRIVFDLVNDTATDTQHQKRQFDLVGRLRYCRSLAAKRYRAGISFERVSVEDVAFLQRLIRDQALKEE